MSNLTVPLTVPLSQSLRDAVNIALYGGPFFNPVERFASGQQGIVVDLNDFTTLWQDTARTVPITAAGQTVKGITDKSGRGNHLSNSTGWVLGFDGSNNYLNSDGASKFLGAGAIAWGAGALSLFMGCQKTTASTTKGIFSFGDISTNAGSFDIGYYQNGLAAYRKGTGSFGSRATVSVGWEVVTAGVVLDLSGTTQATECPYLQVLGADLSLTDYGSANSGTGDFGTYTLTLGAGYDGFFTGRIYSFFAIAETSTTQQLLDGNSWAARKSTTNLITGPIATSAPSPTYTDTGTVTDMGSYTRTSPFAKASYTTEATGVVVSGHSTIYSDFPSYADIGVYVNGSYYSKLSARGNGAFSAFISLPAGAKTVDFVSGATSNPLQDGAFLGTFFKTATANASMTVSAPTPSGRVLVYGDSIAAGGNTTTPVSEAWAMLLRGDYAPESIALEAYGYRSLYIDAVDSTARSAFVAKIVNYAPDRIWLAIGTNDYGLNKWSAASFGTAYAALLDDIHTALPSATIFCQTPLLRTIETANGSGSTLGNYRTQIATAQSTRSSYATLVDGTAIMTTASLADGIHPTTAGHATYKAYVKTVLGI